MTTAIVIQARTGSTRLPGKVLLPLAGQPLLVRMVERVRAAHTPARLIVATTTEKADDPIEGLCRDHGVDVYRGHATDLLDRHYRAALALQADVVAKIPSDCPLIDPAVIDRVLGRMLERPDRFDYVSNLHPPTYPDGNDVEAMTLQSLKTAWHEAVRPFEREHTTPFLWERPDRFRIDNVVWETGRDCSMTHRWTLDYPEDYEFLRRVYEELWDSARPVFALDDVLRLVERRPDLAALNARYAGVNWYRHHLDELTTITRSQTRHP